MASLRPRPLFAIRLVHCRRKFELFASVFSAPMALFYAAHHLNVQLTDFLAQCIPVEAKQTGSLDLIAARGPKAERKEWALHLAQDPIVKAGRRQPVLMGGEVFLQMTLDRCAEAVVDRRLRIGGGLAHVGQLGFDHVDPDDLLGIESCKALEQVLEFSDVAWPTILLEPLHRR